jgi:hypothetical protein
MPAARKPCCAAAAGISAGLRRDGIKKFQEISRRAAPTIASFLRKCLFANAIFRVLWRRPCFSPDARTVCAI